MLVDLASQALGSHATIQDLFCFVKKAACQQVFRNRAEESQILNVAGFALGKYSKIWQGLKSPLYTRELTTSQLKIAANNFVVPHVTQCLNRRGSEFTVLLAPGSKTCKLPSLVVWDSTDTVIFDGCLPWFINWNRVQLDIVCVVASYPVTVLYKTRSKKRKRLQ